MVDTTSGTDTAPLRKHRRWRRRLLLLGVSSLIALLLAEIAVRIGRAILDPGRLSASQLREHVAATPPPGTTVRLGHMLRAAQNPDIVFEFVPLLDVQFQDVRVVINADGFRGPARPKTKPERGYRIVGLGDSVLFGWGVPFEDCGLYRLEQLVQRALPESVVEAIDTAVPGYNTAMEAQVLRDKGLAYSPDLVIVDFVGNDFDLPNYLWEQPNYWALDRSFLLAVVLRGLRWRDQELHGPFVWAPADPAGNFVRDSDRVPPAYRHLVGPEAYRSAMQSICSMGREHGFHVLVTCHHDLIPEALAICTELAVPVVQIGDRASTWLRENGHADYFKSPLVLHADDPHPTAIVHGFWAEAAFARLQELGWLPR
ncbi:MAG TPA: SGNH/GDSL hydrolase family protein [Planctomycetota bacterium]|nr:SGNH/GDSL hydrolase family protein [Planctomycetota bacterium]